MPEYYLKFFFKNKISFVYMHTCTFMCVNVDTHVPQNTYGAQRTTENIGTCLPTSF